MALRERSSGPLITVDTAITLAIEIGIKSTLPATATLTVADAAYQTLPAGSYTPLGLLETVGDLLRTWFKAACAGHAGVTAPALKDNVSLFLDWRPVSGINQTLALLTLGDLGDTKLGALTALTDYVKLKNTNDAWALMGLLEAAAAADRTVNSANVAGTWTADVYGLWQPPGVFTFQKADITQGVQPTFHDVFTNELRDGKVTQTLKGSPSFYDRYTIVDQRATIIGPLYYVGEFSSIKANRKSVYLRVANPSASRMSAPLYDASKLVSGRYYMIGHSDLFLFRLNGAVIVTATTVEMGLFTKVPTLLATPPAKSPVFGVPEAIALYLLSLQNGGLCIYGSDPATGAPNFSGCIYSIRGSGELPVNAQRRDNAHPLYRLEFDLVAHGAPQVVK